MSIRCPNLRSDDTRKEFNDLLVRLGGKPLALSDVTAQRKYVEGLNEDEKSAWARAHYYFANHPSPKSAHAFLNALDEVSDALPPRAGSASDARLNVLGRSGLKAAEYVHHSKVAQAYQALFSPESVSENSMRADPLFAKYKATSAQERDAVQHRADAVYRQWLKVPEAHRIRFLKELESGTLPETGPAAEMGARYRKMLDRAYAEEALYGSQSNYVEDYFPHIWQDPRAARNFFGNLRRQLGPRGFQKGRTFDLIDEGLRAGLKLKSTNPEELVTWRLIASADMKAKMRLLHDLQAESLALPAEGAPHSPELRNWSSVVAPNGKTWLIHHDLNLLWKNAMDSPSLWSNQTLAGSAFRGWMAFKNVWVPIRLAASLFHPIHILHINQAEAFGASVTHVLRGGALREAVGNLANAFRINPELGREARAAWQKPDSEQTPRERGMVRLMELGGFVPQLSEELRIRSSRALAKALADRRVVASTWQGLRRAVEVVQSTIFEKWVPNLKAAAYLNEVRLLAARNPRLFDDPVRLGRELRTIGKSIDNRFGEMFYGGLFWDRTLRDLGTASFLSLSWNLGFLREFGGGLVVDPLKLMARVAGGDKVLLADVSAKTAFSTAYVASAMLLAGGMTWALTGKPPKDWLDYVLPRTGEKNPDGSPHRLSTPMFTREVPQLIKHVQGEGGSWIRGTLDMIANKTLFQPFAELAGNRSYWGFDIVDPNAPPLQQAKQFAEWLGEEQLPPIAVSQIARTQQVGGKASDFVLSFLGFGPAPAYAARSEMQNRIEYLYRRHVAPVSRPLSEEEQARLKGEIRRTLEQAVQSGDEEMVNRAMDEAAKAGISERSLESMKIPGDVVMFRMLPAADQEAILDATNNDEFRRYVPFASRSVRQHYGTRIDQITQYGLPFGPRGR